MKDADEKVSVRDARAPDIPRVVELLGQLAEDPAQEDYAASKRDYEQAYSDMIADPRQRLFVVEAGGRIVGTAVLVIVPNLSHRGTRWATVENVVVDETMRGRGYGERLMAHLETAARRARCYKIVLTSNNHRTDAHRFYERIGYVATHRGYRREL